MIRCEGRYSSFRQLLWFFFLVVQFMYAHFVLRIYFYITCYYCVTWLCIAWLSLLTPPHKRSSLRDPAALTTDGGIHSAEPSFFYQVVSPLTGW